MKNEVKVIKQQDQERENLPLTLDNVKSLLYKINAKPDSQIRLLKGKRIITIADIRNINEIILKRISNNHIENYMVSVNIAIDKNDIKEYGVWEEFAREDWGTINGKTTSMTIIWDFYVKLPLYEYPQRHTLKLRIGKEIAPKDMFQLMFTSDNPSEIKEMSSDAICKVDFVNQMLATDLLNYINNWYEGLVEVPKIKGVQKVLSKYHSFVMGIVDNFTPVLLLFIYVFYSNLFCQKWGIDEDVNLSSINWLLIRFITVYYVGFMIARTFTIWIDKRIDRYKDYSQFIITKGDENSQKTIKEDNWAITRDILWKVALTLLGVVISILVKPIFENWLGSHNG